MKYWPRNLGALADQILVRRQREMVIGAAFSATAEWCILHD
jgi:hypothetical protein